MYWAMLALTTILVAGIALQLFIWLWGIYPMVAIVLMLITGIIGFSYGSWRLLKP